MQTLTLQYYHKKWMPLATTKDISHIKTFISNYRRNFIKYYLTGGAHQDQTTNRPSKERPQTPTQCSLHEHTSMMNRPPQRTIHHEAPSMNRLPRWQETSMSTLGGPMKRTGMMKNNRQIGARKNTTKWRQMTAGKNK